MKKGTIISSAFFLSIFLIVAVFSLGWAGLQENWLMVLFLGIPIVSLLVYFLYFILIDFLPFLLLSLISTVSDSKIEKVVSATTNPQKDISSIKEDESPKIQKLSRIFIILFIIFAGIFIYQLLAVYIEVQNTLVLLNQIDSRITYTPSKSTILTGIPDALTISFLTLIVVAIGTVSTLILSWRNEIRNKKETELRMKKLEFEIADLEKKLETSTKMITEINQENLEKIMLSLEKQKT